jgi:hypothetical protein
MANNLSLKMTKLPWKLLLILVGVIFVVIIAYTIASTQKFYKETGQDFFALWLAPRLILEGKNPYLASDWISASAMNQVHSVKDPTYLYPLPLAVLMIPFGFLPLEYAAVTWISLGIIAILLVCELILSRINNTSLPIPYKIPILLGVFLFRPVAETLRIGQLDWLILLFIALGLFFWEKQHWFVGGMVIALAAVKPQIGIPIFVFTSIWVLMRRKWSSLFGEMLMIFLLCSSGWLINHSWILQWLGSGGNKIESTICCTPTIWGLSSFFSKFDMWRGLIVGIIIATIFSAISICIISIIPSHQAFFAIGLIIPASLLISPYLWTYSQIVLLISIFIIINIMKRRNFHYLLTAPFLLYIALFSGGIVFISMRVGVDVFTSLVPVVIFGLLLWFFLKFYREKSLS